MNRTIFLYGPQTSGKTTRLLRLIKRDHGRDILMSGEDKAQVNNGHEVCDISLRVPKNWNSVNQKRFIKHVKQQLPVQHVLVDGVQFWSPSQVKRVTKLIHQADPSVPILFAGCRDYVVTGNASVTEIPTSRFLLRWCDQTVPVKRTCDFCYRLATQLWVPKFKRLKNHKMVAVDPHLVCQVHFRELRTQD